MNRSFYFTFLLSFFYGSWSWAVMPGYKSYGPDPVISIPQSAYKKNVLARAAALACIAQMTGHISQIQEKLTFSGEPLTPAQALRVKYFIYDFFKTNELHESNWDLKIEIIKENMARVEEWFRPETFDDAESILRALLKSE